MTSTAHDPAKPLDELVHGGSIVMLTTGSDVSMGEPALSSRPITVAHVEGERLEFLIDRTADWAVALPSGARVHATVSDVRANTYLSLAGVASVHGDRTEIERLWNPAAGAYFGGKDDPSIGVLQLDIDTGEYWTSAGGRIGTVITLLKAKLGRPADAGEHGAVAG
jgi:general stress protein 26